MGRRLVESTKASRMRRTRGDIGRFRFLLAVGFAAGFFAWVVWPAVVFPD